MAPRTSLGLGAARGRGDEGASLVEYALLVSLIALVCVGALRYFQAATTESLSRSASAIEGVSP